MCRQPLSCLRSVLGDKTPITCLDVGAIPNCPEYFSLILSPVFMYCRPVTVCGLTPIGGLTKNQIDVGK